MTRPKQAKQDRFVPWWGECELTRKRNYASKTDAVKAIKQLTDVKRMNAYVCDCGFWHVGHATARFRERARSSG